MSTKAKSKSKVCSICNQEDCMCNSFVCPFHGKIKAIPSEIERDGTKIAGFKCSGENCTVQRVQSELEFPCVKKT